jgi:hypothetical protein
VLVKTAGSFEIIPAVLREGPRQRLRSIQKMQQNGFESQPPTKRTTSLTMHAPAAPFADYLAQRRAVANTAHTPSCHIKATQAECLPDEVDDAPDPNLLKNAGRLHCSGNSDKELIIGRRVLSLEKGPAGQITPIAQPAREGWPVWLRI